MKFLRLHIFITLSFFFWMSCEQDTRECHLSYSPLIFYVGFDSLDFSTFWVEKYDKCCGFNNLLSRDTIHFKGQITDTFKLPDMYFPSAPTSYAQPNYNWRIKFNNGVEVNLMDIYHEATRCTKSGASFDPCICKVLDYTLKCVNCNSYERKMGSVTWVYIIK